MPLPSDVPRLFDASLSRIRRNRPAPAGTHCEYLHKTAAEGLSERLALIKRGFRQAVVFGAATADYATKLRHHPGLERLILCDDAEARRHRARAQEEALPDGHAQLTSLVAGGAQPPLAPGQELIISAGELHRMDDPLGALIRCRLALEGDGVLMGVVPGGNTLSELRQCFLDAELEHEGGASAHIAPMATIQDYGALMQRAGFALPALDMDRIRLHYAHPLELMQDLRALGESNILIARRRNFMRRETLARVCMRYFEKYSTPDGKICASFELIYIIGWGPDETQPRPLPPGSATHQLSDFLGERSIRTQRSREKHAGS